jgi:hypothetical protein
MSAPDFISMGEGVIMTKPIDAGVISARFSGLEKNEKTSSSGCGTICSTCSV